MALHSMAPRACGNGRAFLGWWLSIREEGVATLDLVGGLAQNATILQAGGRFRSVAGEFRGEAANHHGMGVTMQRAPGYGG
jgi:hypothetical protein